MRCLQCKQEFQEQRSDAKYCSNSCKQKAKRGAQEGDTKVEHRDTARSRLLPVDQLFNEYRPGYYKFSKEFYNRFCLICGSNFTTSLSLLNACNPDHYEALVSRLSNSEPTVGKHYEGQELPELPPEGENPHHAVLAEEGAKGAYWREMFAEGEQVGYWVIPGAHWHGKKEDDRIWTSCIDPNCSHPL